MENWNTQSDKIEPAGSSPLTDEGIAYCAEEGSPPRLPDDAGNAAKIGFPSEQAHDEACMGDEMAAANGSVHDDAGL